MAREGEAAREARAKGDVLALSRVSVDADEGAAPGFDEVERIADDTRRMREREAVRHDLIRLDIDDDAALLAAAPALEAVAVEHAVT